jgi:hypothetical protein
MIQLIIGERVLQMQPIKTQIKRTDTVEAVVVAIRDTEGIDQLAAPHGAADFRGYAVMQAGVRVSGTETAALLFDDRHANTTAVVVTYYYEERRQCSDGLKCSCSCGRDGCCCMSWRFWRAFVLYGFVTPLACCGTYPAPPIYYCPPCDRDDDDQPRHLQYVSQSYWLPLYLLCLFSNMMVTEAAVADFSGKSRSTWAKCAILAAVISVLAVVDALALLLAEL